MLCVRMTGHGEYRDNVSRVSLEMGMGMEMERCTCVCTLKVKELVCTQTSFQELNMNTHNILLFMERY